LEHNASGRRCVRNDWLASFADPQLEALVTEALTYNADLRAAAARVEQAAGYVKVAGAQLSPDVSIIGKTGSKSGGDAVWISVCCVRPGNSMCGPYPCRT